MKDQTAVAVWSFLKKRGEHFAERNGISDPVLFDSRRSGNPDNRIPEGLSVKMPVVP